MSLLSLRIAITRRMGEYSYPKTTNIASINTTKMNKSLQVANWFYFFYYFFFYERGGLAIAR